AEAHGIGRLAGGVDHLGPGEPVLEVPDPRLDLGLALLGGLELGVLRDVAVGARRLDLLHDLDPVDGLEPLQLALELRVAARRHGDAIRHRADLHLRMERGSSGGEPDTLRPLVGLLRHGAAEPPKTNRRPRGRAPGQTATYPPPRTGANAAHGA